MVSQFHAVHGPEPVFALFAEERFRLTTACSPIKFHRRARGVVAGLNSQRVPRHVALTASPTWFTCHKRVAKQPEHTAISKVHREGTVAPEPAWVATKQLVCLGPSRGNLRSARVCERSKCN